MEEKEELLKALGDTIRKLREDRQMTLNDLAKRSGYTAEGSRSTIQKIEAGKRDLPASKLKPIAEALGITAGELIGIAFKEKNANQYSSHCTLYKSCYDSNNHTIVKKLIALDSSDRARVEERIDILLEGDKYRKKKLNA